MTWALLVFWLSVGVLAYGYVGFPLLVAAAGRVLDRRVHREPVTPRVSLIIAAYNEEDGIQTRLRNALRCEYPPEALEVIVASDGSSDGTEPLVSGFGQKRVRLLSLPRRGKAHALNEAVRHARGEVLVFSDANTHFAPDAVRKLVRNFADPEVGGVAGRTGYVVQDGGESAGRGEGLYWRYDSWLKALETRTGNVVSAHGGMYAIRRELFQPLSDAAVTDDFAISTAVVAQGRRLVFEPEARGYEATAEQSVHEFHRRVRLMTRGLRGALVLRRPLLNPRKHGLYALSLFSHKVLRRFLPAFLPVLLASSVVLHARGGLYVAAATSQGLFYALALIGWGLRRRRSGRWKVLYVPFYFCMANLASLVALGNVLAGRRIERWNPPRHREESVPHPPVALPSLAGADARAWVHPATLADSGRQHGPSSALGGSLVLRNGWGPRHPSPTAVNLVVPPTGAGLYEPGSNGGASPGPPTLPEAMAEGQLWRMLAQGEPLPPDMLRHLWALLTRLRNGVPPEGAERSPWNGSLRPSDEELVRNGIRCLRSGGAPPAPGNPWVI